MSKTLMYLLLLIPVYVNMVVDCETWMNSLETLNA
jgi:hypothetical protein